MATQLPWDNGDDKTLMMLRDEAALPFSKIAAILGRSPSGCLDKYKRIQGGGNSKPSQPVENIKRSCLKCEGDFVADGRFVRICSSCKDSDIFRYASAH